LSNKDQNKCLKISTLFKVSNAYHIFPNNLLTLLFWDGFRIPILSFKISTNLTLFFSVTAGKTLSEYWAILFGMHFVSFSIRYGNKAPLYSSEKQATPARVFIPASQVITEPFSTESIIICLYLKIRSALKTDIVERAIIAPHIILLF